MGVFIYILLLQSQFENIQKCQGERGEAKLGDRQYPQLIFITLLHLGCSTFFFFLVVNKSVRSTDTETSSEES